MNRLLWNISNQFSFSLAAFDGGNLRNAIPREAFATIVLSGKDVAEVQNWIDDFRKTLSAEFGDLEKEMKLTYKQVEMPDLVMDPVTQSKFISLLSCCPHGVIAWSKEMDDLVETSTNLASAKFEEDNIIRIITTQRSSVESSKHNAAGMVESCMRLAGAEVTHSDGYPGWKPNLDSEILNIAKSSYSKLFGREPQVRAIHAGLECGLIYKKVDDIDMISFGPTIKGAHTPEEMIEIKTAQMFWDLLTDILTNIPEAH
jgi:dipeptidase D